MNLPEAHDRPTLMHRLARVACPPGQRGWIDAMFAELAAIEPSERRRWAAGAPAMLVAVLSMRVRALPAAITWGMLLAAHAAIVFAFGSRSDFEGLRMDDDVFFRLAWISGALFVGLGVLAITRIYSHTEASRHRH